MNDETTIGDTAHPPPWVMVIYRVDAVLNQLRRLTELHEAYFESYEGPTSANGEWTDPGRGFDHPDAIRLSWEFEQQRHNTLIDVDHLVTAIKRVDDVELPLPAEADLLHVIRNVEEHWDDEHDGKVGWSLKTLKDSVEDQQLAPDSAGSTWRHPGHIHVGGSTTALDLYSWAWDVAFGLHEAVHADAEWWPEWLTPADHPDEAARQFREEFGLDP